MSILATHKYPALFISYYNFIRIRMKTDALITPAKGNKILSKLLDTDLCFKGQADKESKGRGGLKSENH